MKNKTISYNWSKFKINKLSKTKIKISKIKMKIN